MLVIDNITVRISGRALLEGASVSIADGRKAGFVGRNGTGKTTLLKLILSRGEPDAGEITVSGGQRVGSVAQEAPAGEISLIDTVLAADEERIRLLAALESDHDPLHSAEIHARLDAIGAYSAPARAARILAGLGFSEAEQRRPCREFSGGWRMRVALASVLFAAPDLLLLDEPTNYLDLEGSLWLEDYLKRYRGTVLLVSHDRDLLNRAVDSILHLENKTLSFYSGNYETFMETRSMKRALDAAMRTRQENERKRIQSFVDRFRAKATKARQAQSRIKMLERMTLLPPASEERAAEIKLPKPHGASPPLITLDDVSVGYVPEKPVLTRLHFRIDPDDRIALLGRNGNGKSTLAKLLAGRLRPAGGEMIRARKLVTGYFAQHQLDELDGSITPIETLSRLKPLLNFTALRTQLGGFGFSGDKAETKVSELSGGERARLMLAIATLEKPNLLILDEPTNHLDIDAREQLLAALNDYEGAVILISHDRRLIEACADRLLLVAEGCARPYEGDLDEYRKLVLTRANSNGNSVESLESKSASKSALRRESAGKRDALKPLKRAMETSERAVHRIQEEIASLDRELAAPNLFAAEPAKGEALAKRRADCLRGLYAAEALWLKTAEDYETKRLESE